jgi:hypothetical protein
MTAETVQAGHQYPNVTRVLKPGSEEYDWFNEGGSYPYVPPMVITFIDQPDNLTIEHPPITVTFTDQPNALIIEHLPIEVTFTNQPNALTIEHLPITVTFTGQPSNLSIEAATLAITGPDNYVKGEANTVTGDGFSSATVEFQVVP